MNCKFLRINPDGDKFSVFTEINRIFEHIKQVKDKEINEVKEMINNLKIN